MDAADVDQIVLGITRVQSDATIANAEYASQNDPVNDAIATAAMTQ